MSAANVARVTHIIAESPEGLDDEVKVVFKRAATTFRSITGLRIV